MSATGTKNVDQSVIVKLQTDQEQSQGLLLEMGPRTVGILVEKGDLSKCQLGDRATVTILGDEVGGEHVARAYLLGVHPAGDGQRLTFRYADVADYERLLTTGLGRRYNRRASFRVEPALEKPIVVSIKDANGAELTGKAMDLSATGLALVIDGDMDLTSGQTLHLGFSVAWDPRPLSFMARVCYCGERDGEMRYGVDFLEHQTEDFELTQDRLVDYVMKRQREILRRANQVQASESAD